MSIRIEGSSGSGGGASSVSNVDGTLTISPTTGAVVASLNLGHANTWTATQTFRDILAGTTNTYDIGTNAVLFRSGYFDTSLRTRVLEINRINGYQFSYVELGYPLQPGSDNNYYLGTNVLNFTEIHSYKYGWPAGTTAPTPQTLLTLPLNVYGQGTITDLLGDPDAWLNILINGSAYKIPAYLP